MALVRNMHIGDKQISKPYLGATPLTAVYLGDKFVWGQYCYNLYFINASPSIISYLNFYTLPLITSSNACNSGITYNFDNTPYTYLKTEELYTATSFEIVYRNTYHMQSYVYVSTYKPTISGNNLTLPTSYDRYVGGEIITYDSDYLTSDDNDHGGTYAISDGYSDGLTIELNNDTSTYMWLVQEKFKCTFITCNYRIGLGIFKVLDNNYPEYIESPIPTSFSFFAKITICGDTSDCIFITERITFDQNHYNLNPYITGTVTLDTPIFATGMCKVKILIRNVSDGVQYNGMTYNIRQHDFSGISGESTDNTTIDPVIIEGIPIQFTTDTAEIIVESNADFIYPHR